VLSPAYLSSLNRVRSFVLCDLQTDFELRVFSAYDCDSVQKECMKNNSCFCCVIARENK